MSILYNRVRATWHKVDMFEILPVYERTRYTCSINVSNSNSDLCAFAFVMQLYKYEITIVLNEKTTVFLHSNYF